jgi:hypothetical protein
MILTGVIIIVFIGIYYFLYNIYEVKVEVQPKYLYADSNSTVEIKVIPVNALGFRAIFRNTKSKFEIIEGASMIKIIYEDNESSILKIKSTGSEGKVGIKIFNSHSLFPQYIEIPVLPLKV